MEKKSLIIILSAVLLALLLPAFSAFAEDAPVEIHDAAGLAAIADDPEGDYVLTADINLAGISWTPLPFRGSFDGKGHSIYNLSVTAAGEDQAEAKDGNHIPYSASYAGLFSVTENADIRSVRIIDADVQVTCDNHCYCGILAGYSDMSLFTDCYVSGRVWLYERDKTGGVGGLIGYGACTIKGCTADTELVYVDRYTDGKCEQFTGGLVANGYGRIEDCRVAIDAYISCNGYVHSGGLMGMFGVTDMHGHWDKIKNNYVSGAIHFYENNTDRRAYCAPYCGEFLRMATSGTKTNLESFTVDETFDYSAELYPEKCASPDYVAETVPATATEWGYTVHTCAVCGYSFTDSYTAPGTVPDEPEPEEPEEDVQPTSEDSAPAEETSPENAPETAAEARPEGFFARLRGFFRRLFGKGRDEASAAAAADEPAAVPEAAAEVIPTEPAPEEESPEDSAEILPEPAPEEFFVPEPVSEIAVSFDINNFINEKATDGDFNTVVRFSNSDTMKIISNDGSEMYSLYIIWFYTPGEWTIVYPDGTEQPVTSDFLHQYVSLNVPASEIELRFPSGTKNRIIDIHAFSDGNVYPDYVQMWHVMPDGEADILLFPTHSDDEIVFFGGIMPLYAGELGYKVQVCYLICHDSVEFYRSHEALDGLWRSGIRYYPVFNFAAKDMYFETLWGALEQYGETQFHRFQVEQIRRFKPLVIIGHDENGEYGHGVHQLNTFTLKQAIYSADDSDMFPESYEKYGLWDTPKVYLHLYGDDRTVLDENMTLKNFENMNLYDASMYVFWCYPTQRNYDYRVYHHWEEYDSFSFGLYYTAVGPDIEKNDILEHVSRADFPSGTEPAG